MSCSCLNSFTPLMHMSRASKGQNSILAISLRRNQIQCSKPPYPSSLWRQTVVPMQYPVANHSTCIQRDRPPQVKSGDAEEALSSDGMILDEQTLERDLKTAIEEENYARAAKIRDYLRVLHEDSKASILAANARFYNAFRNGDLAAMHTIWANGENIFCVHPGAGGISGHDLVMGSWELVCGAEHEFPLLIDLKNVEVHVRGDVGYVTCMEVVKTKGSSWGKQVATNVFERINGQWLLCIHHASHIDL